MNFLLMNVPTYQDIQEARRNLMDISEIHWWHNDFLSATWWVLLAATLIPYFIWWKIVDKERFFEIFSYGLFCGCVAVTLDVIGVDTLKWGYPDKLFSMFPPLFPADLVVIPISAMLVFQYFPTWKSFIVGTILWAILFAYVIEPIFIKFNMLHFDNWTHNKSFIGFFILGLFTRLVIRGLIRGVKKKQNQTITKS